MSEERSSSSQEMNFPSSQELDRVMGNIFTNPQTDFDFEIGLGLDADDLEESINLGATGFVKEEQQPSEGETYYWEIVEKEEKMAGPTSSLPCTETFAGALNFEFEIEEINPGRSSFLFSPVMSKIFVNFGAQCPIKFRWSGTRSNLFVRALPVYISSQDFLHPVERCQLHRSPTDKMNDDFPFPDHVVRTDQADAQYILDPISERLSVLVPLNRPQPGSDTVTVMFRFMCKNSCTTGMNRRSTKLIFTLEDSFGRVLGRQTVNFRVCSCPKRDKEKEEKMKEKEEKINIKSKDEEVIFSSQESSSGSCSKRKLQSGSSSLVKRRKTNVSGNGLVLVPVPIDECLQPVLITALGALHAKTEIQGRALTPKETELKEKYKALMREYAQK